MTSALERIIGVGTWMREAGALGAGPGLVEAASPRIFFALRLVYEE
jgi:hypothetical protein